MHSVVTDRVLLGAHCSVQPCPLLLSVRRLRLRCHCVQAALTRREAEVQRLAAAAAAGPSVAEVDALAARYRTDASEALVLQLNQQVGEAGESCCDDAECVGGGAPG